MIRGRGNILEIPVDDAVVVQVLHAGQDGTGDKTMPISLSLPSPGEEQSNVHSFLGNHHLRSENLANESVSIKVAGRSSCTSHSTIQTILPALSVFSSPSPPASATIFFPPIEPSHFNDPGQSPASFRCPENILSLLPLSQPEADPSIVMDIDNSVAIDQVRALLSSDFTNSRASWLHLLASLITDARNGARTSIATSSIRRFADLSTAEQATTSHLKLALESLEIFFTDVQDDPDDWITCMGCIQAFHLPSSKDEWSANLSACSGAVEEARRTIVDQAIATAHLHIQSWVDSERLYAQDAAITSLTSDHAPEIGTLISDPRVVEWSRRLLEVMKHHFTETLVSDASHALPQSLVDRLDAERQAKFNSAEEDACADAKRLYDAELLRRQTATLSAATVDFHQWTSSTLNPKFRAKEAEACAQADREFARFKTDLEAESAANRQSVLKAANGDLAAFQLVHAQVPEPRPDGDDSTLDKQARRAKRRANPIHRASRSVSHARSPSPSPSQKLDKTPTKADFQVSQQATVSVTQLAVDKPLVGPDNAKVSVGTLGDADSGRTSTPSCPGTLPAAAHLDNQLTSLDVVMTANPARVDTCPSSAEPERAHGTEVTARAALPISVPPDPTHVVPLVEPYRSVTPSPAPPPTVETAEDRMMRLLGSTLSAALVPLKASIEDIGTRLHAVEDTQNWALGDGDLEPIDYGYCIPTVKLEDGDEEHADYHVASSLSRAADEDAKMDDAREKWNNIHPYFESIILRAREDRREDYDDGQLQALAHDAYDDWSDFCARSSIPSSSIPPSDVVDETFFKLVRIRLSQAQVLDDYKRSARLARGSTISTAPDVSYFTGAWRGKAHLLRKDGRDKEVETSPLPPPPPAGQASQPVSVSSDGSRITDSTPPAHERHQGDDGILDISMPPLGDGHGWTVMGGKKGRSFASIAAKPTPSPAPAVHTSGLPPSAAQAAHGFLTKPQLDSLTRAQVINVYNARFSPKLGLKVPKENAIAAFLDKASRPAPVSSPPPKAITKAEFTLVYDLRAGDLAAPSGRRGDAASYVRLIQAHVRNAGTKQAELIGGWWTSQTSCNFVLTFNGNPSLDEVLRLCSIFTKVFGPHYSIVPSKGYTQVVLNSVPTMRESIGDPLPSADDLCVELARNAGLKDLILLGAPYWLMARNPNARHGSISIVFIDQDGWRLKDIMHNPPFLFGNRTTKPRKYEAHPLISQCDHCWQLGHVSSRCLRPKDTVICPLCAGQHTKDEHHKKCQAVSKHTEVYCTCPIVCINCRRVRKPAQGHTALSLSCPLWAKFCSPFVRSGDSSDEEKKGVEALQKRAPSSLSPDIVMLADGENPAPPTVVAPASSL